MSEHTLRVNKSRRIDDENFEVQTTLGIVIAYNVMRSPKTKQQ